MTRASADSVVPEYPAGLTGAHIVTAPLTRVERIRYRLRDRTWPLAAVLGLVAFAIRAVGLARANDLFIDELTYAEVANNVADGRLPQQFGEPFFLHPIGSFVLNGLVIRMFGLTGSFMDMVYPLRWVNTVLGAVTVVLAVFLVRRVAGTGAAAVAGVVLAFDPFVLRQDGRVMIETPATLWLVAGWLVLLSASDRPVRTRRALTAGLLLGLALVTKDLTALSSVVPLVLAGLWRRTLPWATVRRVLVAVPVPYLVYLAVVAGNGLLPALFDAKIGGFLRLIGVDQETGFNSNPSADLAGRLIEMITRFGTSYVLLGLGMFAGVAAAFSAVAARRAVGLIAAVTGVVGIYCVVAGAAEEQLGYYVVVTSVLALGALWGELVERRPGWRRPAAAGAAVFTLLTVGLGISARTTADNAYPQARAFLRTLPADSRVGLTDVTGEFGLLPHSGWGVWPSLTSLQTNGAQYVLTRSHQLSQGYGYAAPGMLDWLAQHGTPVFTTTGPSGGDTVVWRLDRSALDESVAAGQTLPPVSGDYP
jgi:4-amino-4-deoxy-L-arabinose transferase-like glycosyltransferase